MKENWNGKTVLSLSGHDKGRLFLVVGDDGHFLWLADGKSRRLERPKKKNRKHTKLLPSEGEFIGVRTDGSLRKALSEAAKRLMYHKDSRRDSSAKG